ncbi:MAG: hypothetical protein HPY76_00075 [Anaerolineae bacterium]|jgi:uncharacterized protein with HEPN domain|nr:hypothetical protein [Anaerolineae bacterium]
MKKTVEYIEDMLDAKTIESFQVASYDAFIDDVKIQDAVMFNLIIMSEAANKLLEYCSK